MATSLSFGLALYDMLGGCGCRVFPVFAPDGATLPYVVYARQHQEEVQVKNGLSADTATIRVDCYASTYRGAVELSETVRELLDGMRTSVGGVNVRSCFFSDAQEGTDGEAYIESLVFTLRA